MVSVGYTQRGYSGSWDRGLGQGESGGDTLSFVVPVLGGRLPREVQDQPRPEGSHGEAPLVPCGFPI